ncbi:hypothetical protein DFH06DRAFT_1123963 [Mycena polygramma]|nr:hypothetical protein DFH06DRAFT_1123963 [Mycena polygramma]
MPQATVPPLLLPLATHTVHRPADEVAAPGAAHPPPAIASCVPTSARAYARSGVIEEAIRIRCPQLRAVNEEREMGRASPSKIAGTGAEDGEEEPMAGTDDEDVTSALPTPAPAPAPKPRVPQPSRAVKEHTRMEDNTSTRTRTRTRKAPFPLPAAVRVRVRVRRHERQAQGERHPHMRAPKVARHVPPRAPALSALSRERARGVRAGRHHRHRVCACVLSQSSFAHASYERTLHTGHGGARRRVGHGERDAVGDGEEDEEMVGARRDELDVEEEGHLTDGQGMQRRLREVAAGVGNRERRSPARDCVRTGQCPRARCALAREPRLILAFKQRGCGPWCAPHIAVAGMQMPLSMSLPAAKAARRLSMSASLPGGGAGREGVGGGDVEFAEEVMEGGDSACGGEARGRGGAVRRYLVRTERRR